MDADMNKINQLLEHLNISQVFMVAGQIPTDMIKFLVKKIQKRFPVLLTIGTTEIDSSPF